MLKRSITGLVILLVCAGFVALREVSPFFFDAFALVIIYGSLLEMNFAMKLCDKKASKAVVFAVPVLIFAIFAFAGNLAILRGKELLLILLVMLIAFAVLMVKELISNAIKRKRGETETNVDELNKSLLNQTKDTMQLLAYPTLLLGFFIGINHLGQGIGYVGIIMTFAITMTTDVFAYLFGSLIGGTKMAPEISPKKSVAGMIAGFIGGIVVAGIGLYLFHFLGWFNSSIAFAQTWKAIVVFAILGVVGSLLTQMGDLVASSIKRKVGIKDFGSIFPGHGGFMDRMDGLMFNATLIYIIFTLFL